MFIKVCFSLIYHLTNFDALVDSGFCVIPKTTFANLCKSVFDVIIIPALNIPLYLKNGEKEGGKLQTVQYSEKEKRFLDEMKMIFHNS